MWHWCFCFPLCGIFLFQSTHPRRVWLRFRHCLKESLTCFNPHTHAGCDRSGRFTLCCSMDVSIHTPTQGVTTLAAVNSRNPRVSIHTPTQGVTQAEVWKVWHRSFNPHTHAGCDQVLQHISLPYRCFNPHTHAGCDWKHLQDHHASRFQSTHPRRVWLSINAQLTLYGSFNPHTHAGCDCWSLSTSFVYYVSIHTPTQGVTLVLRRQRKLYLFQSTHPRRVWLPNAIRIGRQRYSFNPHTHAGCDMADVRKLAPFILFQSTHPRRVWLTSAGAWSYQSMFQSTHPRRVWLHLHLLLCLMLLSFNPHTHAGCDFFILPFFAFPLCFNPHTHAGCDWLWFIHWFW